MLGFDGATRTPTLPHSPPGRPLPFSCVQVSPPSAERYRPLPGPPLLSFQGSRFACHRPANRMRGFDGSIATSAAPVNSSLYRTFCQFLPPSVVR